MKALKIVVTVLGVLTVFPGLIFLIGGRPVAGAVILLTGIFLVVSGLRKPRTRDVVVKQELELSGDVNLETMKCSHCGGSLSADNVAYRAGTVFVTCPYCASEYQIEEAPKW